MNASPTYFDQTKRMTDIHAAISKLIHNAPPPSYGNAVVQDAWLDDAHTLMYSGKLDWVALSMFSADQVAAIIVHQLAPVKGKS